MTAIAYAKIAAIVAVLAALVLVSFHLGGLGPKAELAKYKAAIAQAQAQNATKELATTITAENAYDEDLTAIAVPVVRDRILVRELPPAGGRVQLPAQAGSSATDRGAVDPGSGEHDIRDALNAFEVKYERILAQCRRLDAEWPK
jgi:hypothetical protein